MNKKIARTAIIAVLYFVLTMAVAPLSFGPVQFRFSECLTMLAIFYPEAIIGLTVGCFFSNLLGTGLVLDMVFGTLATFLSSLLTYIICKRLRKIIFKSIVSIVFNVVLNAFLVPICFVGFTYVPNVYFYGVLTVGFGQLVVLCTLGILVSFSIDKLMQKSELLQ